MQTIRKSGNVLSKYAKFENEGDTLVGEFVKLFEDVDMKTGESVHAVSFNDVNQGKLTLTHALLVGHFTNVQKTFSSPDERYFAEIVFKGKAKSSKGQISNFDIYEIENPFEQVATQSEKKKGK